MSIFTISSLLKQVMSAMGLQQKELAEVLDVTLDRVKSLTSGKVKKLSSDKTRRLVQALNLSAHWLATGEGPMFDSQGGEALGEQLSQLRLCSAAVASMGFEGDTASAARDIAYGVATGNAEIVRSGVELLRPALSADEQEMLALFRTASLTGKAAAIGALQGAAGATHTSKIHIAGNASGQIADVIHNTHAPVARPRTRKGV